jgi:hydrophobic/amphiphilic exporter-1 (mainly G- bacteria), HAE1 family
MWNSNIGAGSSATGSGVAVASNSGSLFIKLKSRDERQASADEVVQDLRSKLADIPGLQVFLQTPPAIPIGTQQTTGAYQIALQSTDVEPLKNYVPQLVAKLRLLPELQDVNSDLQMTSQVKIEIDWDKASTLGLTTQQIETALRNAYGAYQVSTIYGATNEYQVILELDPKYRQDANALSSLYVTSTATSATNPNSQVVPLSTFATISQTTAPLIINHAGRMNAATISYNLAPGVALGAANQSIDELLQSAPDTITSSFKGASQVFQSSLPSLGILLAIAILVIYLILGILYEDFIHPITILSGLPSAGFGALLTLIICHVELNVYSFIGIILLVGIVKKNGIMMVDFAIEEQREKRTTPATAIYQACLVRFRPIMMTTMAALMGTLPIAIGFGAEINSDPSPYPELATSLEVYVLPATLVSFQIESGKIVVRGDLAKLSVIAENILGLARPCLYSCLSLIYVLLHQIDLIQIKKLIDSC